jgi:hypothetical protein
MTTFRVYLDRTVRSYVDVEAHDEAEAAARVEDGEGGDEVIVRTLPAKIHRID